MNKKHFCHKSGCMHEGIFHDGKVRGTNVYLCDFHYSLKEDLTKAQEQKKALREDFA